MEIVNVGGNKCLDVKEAGRNNGTQVQQWDCGGAPNQRWMLGYAGDGFYQLHPLHADGLALDVSGYSTDDGAKIQIWGWGTQRFGFVAQSDSSYEIVSEDRGKCVDVAAWKHEQRWHRASMELWRRHQPALAHQPDQRLVSDSALQ